MYPRYGRRLVLLAFATGLRINELLALRHDSIDLKTGEVTVDWQLDRYQPWPTLRPPKDNKTRVAFLWAFYTDVASSLIADSLALDEDDEHPAGSFPGIARPRRGRTGLASSPARPPVRANGTGTSTGCAISFASDLLTGKKFGGFKLDPVSVQEWLGHARLSTTQDMYVERQSDDVTIARKRTGRAPGTV